MKKFKCAAFVFLLFAFSFCLCSCSFLGSCFNNPAGGAQGGGNNSAGVIQGPGDYNDYISYSLRMANREDCPGGRIDDEKLNYSLNISQGNTYYMVLDCNIKSFEWVYGLFDITVYFWPAAKANFDLQEADTAVYNRHIEDGETVISASFRTPEDYTQGKTYRIVYRMTVNEDCAPVVKLAVNGGNIKEIYGESSPFRLKLSQEQDYYILYGVNDSSITTATVPELFNKLPVREIGGSAFGGTKIQSVSISKNITHIASNAFSGCDSLSSLSVSGANPRYMAVNGIVYNKEGTCAEVSLKNLESVKLLSQTVTVAQSAFSGCKNLKSLSLPDNVRYIADGAFNNCTSLKDIVLPQDLIHVSENAFNNCTALTSAKIPAVAAAAMPKSLTSVEIVGEGPIPNNAFRDFGELASIKVSSGITDVGSEAFTGSRYWNNNSNWNNGLLYLGHILLGAANDKLTNHVDIKEGVTAIADGAFYNCSRIERAVLPQGVLSIGDSAFASCKNLQSITLPQSLRSIGQVAFSGCLKLQNITLPPNLLNIGYQAFSGVPALQSAADGTYMDGYLIETPESLSGTFTVRAGTLGLADYAMSQCAQLTEIILPNSVKFIGQSAFLSCASLTSINLPDGLERLGNSVFEYCSSLKTVSLPAGITQVTRALFWGCSSLQTVNFGGNVREIGQNAFWSCGNLAQITIPQSVLRVCNGAFSGCYGLQTAVFEGTGKWRCAGVVDASVTVDVSDPSSAAGYLTDDFLDYDWIRTAVS